MRNTRLAEMPLVALALDDHGYSEVPIDPDAEANPDKFAVIPKEFTDGNTLPMYVRVPVINVLRDVLAPIARKHGKRVVVKQAYASREQKLAQWRELYDVAYTVKGYDPSRMTIAQEIECGDLADAWGSYREVNPIDHKVARALDNLKVSNGPELAAYAKKHDLTVNDVALKVLSFRASRGQLQLSFTNSGFSVFMSGGHVDLELVDAESGIPDYYGVPMDLLDTVLADRMFFEDDDNLPKFEAAADDPQIRVYNESLFDGRMEGLEAFLMAQADIRTLQGIAAEAGLTPWYGSVRTFSVPNTSGGRQARRLVGYGDQAHAKKLHQPVAVWPRLVKLPRTMIEG